MVGTIDGSASYVGKIITCILQRNPSGFTNLFHTVAITQHDHEYDDFLYVYNFGVMIS